MNKFVLEITLGNDDRYSLTIKIIHWDDRFMYDSSDDQKRPFAYFTDKNNFKLLSVGNGLMTNDSFEVPNYKSSHDKNGRFIGAELKRNFSDDIDRYNYLKMLYHCLNEWSVSYFKFKNDPIYNKNIMMSKKLWVK